MTMNDLIHLQNIVLHILERRKKLLKVMQETSPMLKLLSKGNQSHVQKKLDCSLCARERLETHKAMTSEKENDTNSLIISLNELRGACRKNLKFHCTIIPQSADGAANTENVCNI